MDFFDSKMNLLFLLFLFGVFSTGYSNQKKIVNLSPEKAGPIMDAIGRCLTETNTSQDVVVEINERKFKDSENNKKFIHCAFDKAGYVNDNGHVKVDKMMELFPNDPDVRPVLENCDKNPANGPEEKINAFFKCFLDKSPAQVAL